MMGTRQLGQFFKAARLTQGLTLEQAAGDWSAATLLRFERGETDIALASAFTLMRRLGIETADLAALMAQDPGQVPALLPLIFTNQREAIIQAKARYLTAHDGEADAATALITAYCDAAANWMRPDFALTAQQEQQIADLMTAPRTWHDFELTLCSALIGPASPELIGLLWRRSQAVAFPKVTNFHLIVAALFFAGLATGDAALIAEMVPTVEAATHDSRFARVLFGPLPRWRFGLMLAAWQSGTAETGELEAFLASLDAIDEPAMASYLRRVWWRVAAAVPHHNHDLVVAPLQDVWPTRPGEWALLRRQQLHLTAQAVSVGWAASTTRRFERGQTQLGLSRVFALLGKLAQLSTNFSRWYPTHQPMVTASGAMVAAWEQNAAPAAIRQIVQDFATTYKDVLPWPLWRAQLSALVGSADTAIPAGDPLRPTPADQAQLFSRLVTVTPYHASELWLVALTGSWFSAAQCVALAKHLGAALGPAAGYMPRLLGIGAVMNLMFRVAEDDRGQLPALLAADPHIQLADQLEYAVIDYHFNRRVIAWLIEPTAATQAAVQDFAAHMAVVGVAGLLPELKDTWASNGVTMDWLKARRQA
ncbi:helix-turn-helix domain-containing protein [Lacticaseibacillus parakribbianus]|uniref:helix-turn-helix domain-containing protein n=1 Tax=Lacticaseibacillus parakribbianus TaxID=2970927 RepID=UPI0021CAF152|nr:helix-turn-helix transcriptional regulator [Lacticaseibacillus parakribbianus]